MMSVRFLAMTIALLFSSLFTQAGIIQYQLSPINSTIDYTIGWSLPKYDLSLPLKKIVFELTATIEGYSRGENLSLFPVEINLKNEGRFRQSDQFGNQLFDFTVFQQDTFNAQSFDGSFPPDWSGPSGAEYRQDTLISRTEIFEIDDPFILGMYTGVGNVFVPASAKGISSTSFSGSNMVVSQYETKKGLHSLIKYYYEPVPEPKTYGIIAILICLVMITIKKLHHANITTAID